MTKNVLTSIEKTRITVIAIIAIFGLLLGASVFTLPGQTILPGELQNQAFSETSQTIAVSETVASVEPFNYDDYTYTAFWYRWILVDGKQTTEPLFRPGLSYESCLVSLYCNPDLEQGRVLKAD